jgi:FkbH-like protein
MTQSPDLHWLPPPPADWRARLRALAAATPDRRAWEEAVGLARHDLSFQATNALATVTGRLFGETPADPATPVERLAVLSTSTTTHLLPALHVGALRRGILLVARENDYGLYRQALVEEPSWLVDFAPTAVLFALDAEHVARGVAECADLDARRRLLDRFLADLRGLWRIAGDRFGARVLQQTIVPRFPRFVGNNEHRDPGSAAAFVDAVDARLREIADADRVDLVAVDDRIAIDGLAAWYDPTFWFRAKQEIALPAAPMFGDLVGRLVAARRGRTAKCCVFDLDDTLWGGVVGDEGALGVTIGQGSALGEAFVAIHRHALDLRRRGILLAVCSKNDEAVARAVFRDNPDMVLKEEHIACFVANWTDKAENLRTIARRLGIGLDTLVFVDDNPFERDLVRRELPMVFVPEVPAAPELVPACLADGGFFESTDLTAEDFARAGFYRDRPVLDPTASSTDLEARLGELDMVLEWGRIDAAALPRTAQLVNKTNQFNLTTRRRSEAELERLVAEPGTVGLQMRLVDRYGDQGLVVVVIARPDGSETWEIDTWLMSCRVLGRRVEEATLNVLAAAVAACGGRRLVGVYRPTAKNEMVRPLYRRLGFETIEETPEEVRSALDLATFVPFAPPLRTREVVR